MSDSYQDLAKAAEAAQVSAYADPNEPQSVNVPSKMAQTIVGGGVLLVAIALAIGALQIPGDAGYGGVGPNFLPWVCAAVLGLCGAMLIWEAQTDGFRHAADPGGEAKANIGAFVWVSAGLLINAALIGTIGFIFSCTLCYVLAVQGLRRAAHETNVSAPSILIKDAITGLLISAPVFWMFTQFLAINLPGLTQTGWL
ncbi:tripartite tricarboxylate transporter TctB family protein [Comamonas sp. Y33R10-2]|uniref:tripartite tricarboxylate transporter TctB family protein n=1 Tax=Comamonas sp. Y33R10-2 TaxID=2853257 RepID=UPI001C5C9FBA|nr:tripartite tricarboxylate transporter TctB family protein [Comamonas sp. Y33R10-2]QXZ08560.1 tripartite tricarboxylate transporter TctB family protein [Comamonas sp. Y33R10-2]